MATTSIEDLSKNVESLDSDLWFQLYVWRDRALTNQLIGRAADRGFRVLEIAVDTSVAALRIRDAKNGFTIPPKLTLASLADIGMKPKYWLSMLANPALEFANVSGVTQDGGGYTISNITSQFDPSVTWSDVESIRKLWPGKLVIKGPVGAVDAQRARDIGVDAVHLSNHGGRQLDSTISPVHLVHGVRDAVGKSMEIFVDSGVRSGADIATAIALGADAAFVGRPYLYGLAAGGRLGVDKVISLLHSELKRTMQLLGVASIRELRDRGSEFLVANPH
jgi:L-lactate dehydrogenase (cytochrome)